MIRRRGRAGKRTPKRRKSRLALRVEVYELAVPDAWRGRTLAELVAGVECAPVSLTRGGRAALPLAGSRLEAGDQLQVSASQVGATTLRARLFGEA